MILWGSVRVGDKRELFVLLCVTAPFLVDPFLVTDAMERYSTIHYPLVASIALQNDSVRLIHHAWKESVRLILGGLYIEYEK